MMTDTGDYVLRPARVDEAPKLATIFIEEVSWSRLKEYGHRFLTLMHRHWIESPYGVVIVLDRGGEIAGYGAGLSDSRRYHRSMVLRHGWKMFLVALPRMFNRTNLETIIRTFTYFPRAPKDDPAAELVAMNVSSRHRRGGFGRKLYNALMEELKKKGVKTVKLGHVDPDNETANAYWIGVGGRFLRRERFYKNKEVNVYVYDIP